MEYQSTSRDNKYDSRYAVILAGGSGIRLWPLSREALPKQLIPVLEGKSLLEVAFYRLDEVIPAQRRWICGGQRFESAIRSKIPALGRYLGEPVGRDTLAAIGYSCEMLMATDRNAVVAFLTSDHIIRPVERFREALSFAFKTIEANPDALLTFGIKPTYPSTAYGYLEVGEPIDKGLTQQVLRFKEKPDLSTAKCYCRAGARRYLWNSGMFVWRAERFLELLNRYEPDIAQALKKIVSEKDPVTHADVLTEIYPSIRKKSVDYGIMEPASLDPEVRILCLPLDLDWNDIGSWTTYGSLAPIDKAGNTAIQALPQENVDGANNSILFFECTNTLVVSTDPKHLIACFGCDGLTIIYTKDATFICPKERVEEIKKLHTEVNYRFNGKYT